MNRNQIWSTIEKKTVSLAKSLAKPHVKELKDTGAKKFDENTVVNAGLSLLGKKIKKGI